MRAAAVVNATGAWADRLRGEVGGRPRIRPLRGSHLLFPAWRFPAAQAVTFRHPLDGRPLFAYPWEGLTLLGTTDLDHPAPLDEEPSIAAAEAAYLLEGARAAFPSLSLTARDAVSSFAGVRPVIGTGKARPSEESRDHVLWEEAGLLTVTGGKLTTFRLDRARRAEAPPQAAPGPVERRRRRSRLPCGRRSTFRPFEASTPARPAASPGGTGARRRPSSRRRGRESSRRSRARPTSGPSCGGRPVPRRSSGSTISSCDG